MSLLDVVRSGIKVANGVTRPLQCVVSYRQYASSDGAGAKIYVPPVASPALPIHAIVELGSDSRPTREGILGPIKATLTLIDIAEVVAATAGVGVNIEDLFTLTDGRTCPVIALGKDFVDAGTGHPIATTVMLG